MWKSSRVVTISIVQMMLTIFSSSLKVVDGFSSTPLGAGRKIRHLGSNRNTNGNRDFTLFSTPFASTKGRIQYTPIFDFSNDDDDAVSKFERIDDAIMGGISTSALRRRDGEDFARWSGVCRLDGGGFCGTRTLPFQEPLQVGDADGIYLISRLTSDKEPERRVWKITTRSEESRGEKLYQAAYTLPKGSFGDWSQVVPITVPFSDFKLVSGPRMMVEASPLNVTGGLYQLGLSLSKFQIAQNLTEIENFLPGFFELQIKEIGFYRAHPQSETEAQSEIELVVSSPETLSKEEADKQKPMLVKILLPVFKTLFSEKSRRRKSAMRILRDRGFSRFGAMKYGVLLRSATGGMAKSIGQLCGILAQDVTRTILSTALRVIFLPLRYVSKAIFALRKLLRRKDEPAPKRM